MDSQTLRLKRLKFWKHVRERKYNMIKLGRSLVVEELPRVLASDRRRRKRGGDVNMLRYDTAGLAEWCNNFSADKQTPAAAAVHSGAARGRPVGVTREDAS